MKKIKNYFGYILLVILVVLSVISFSQEKKYKELEEKDIPLEQWMFDPSSWGNKILK